MSANGGNRVLFMDKVLLSPCEKAPRGVELFNLNLLRDLAGLGLRVTAVLHPSWAALLRGKPGGANVECVSGLRGVLFRKFDVFLLGNVANRLVPALVLLRMFRVAPRCVLIAHREPSRRSVIAQKAWPSTVVTVNDKIAGHYKSAGFGDVAVSYGITDADRFHPAGHERREHQRINFCVLGHLDSPWKGADTAMAAFRGLAEDVAARCGLHLASYKSPPDTGSDRIVAHSWMPFEKMPDFLRSMDILLVPSRDEDVMRETFSQAMVQGMLTGLPVIAADLPILTEKLDAGGGLVFNTVEELTRHMADLVHDHGARRTMGEAARKTALERYVWNTAEFSRRFLFREG